MSRHEGRKALPDGFVAWLLDQDRWGREGFGDAWCDEGSLRAAEFIRRSVDSWSDEDMLCELKRLGDLAEAGKRLSVDQMRLIHLLAWWITLNRGLVPGDFSPDNPRRRTYGDIVTTHVGRAVYSGLSKKNRHLVHESGEIAPAMAEAYRTIFDVSLMQTLDYLCKTECKVVDMCRKYKPGSGDAWGYLHRCIENYVHDFLESKDKEVSVPTMNMADRFRRIWKAAERQVNPPDAGPAGADEFSQDEQMETLAWRSHRGRRDDDDESEDPETSEPRQGIPSDAAPVARAALLLKYTAPTDWSDVSVDDLARDLGLEDTSRGGFVELVTARGRRLELSVIRRDACFEKREYLRVLKERTREGLKAALGREGHSRDQIKQRIDLLEKQASEGEVLLGEVRAVQKDKDCPVDSQAYLAARFQELILSEGKMSRYAANYDAEWENRYAMAPDELKSLAEVFSTTPDEVKRQLTGLEQMLGLL
ncbi:MAG: hypothetical protein JW955_04400 [Sedimentisphaerales bacterium]|nr:hypothetical protein [Sedimentisphaerales bacterium]